MNMEIIYNDEHEQMKYNDFLFAGAIICIINFVAIIGIGFVLINIIAYMRWEMIVTLFVIVMTFGTIGHFVFKIEKRIIELEESVESKIKEINKLQKILSQQTN